MALSLTTATPAQAELLNPRQEWLRNSSIGLFLHWGMFTAPIHLDCQAWERDVTDGGWTPEYWVSEAEKLHASYIVLATFHSRLGYARPWPSAIPGSCATQRDFLGELTAAAKAEGIRVILYMTDDPQWHNEQGVETLDSAAYSAYKGHQVDLTTRDGFGEFSYDLFFEVMDRYPDLAGFWIDNDNAYWERNNLYEQIRERRPSWTLSNNNEDTPIMDMVSHEQKTGMTPAYDYPAAVWTPQPRLTEGEWKLPDGGTWWYDGQDRNVDYPLNIGRVVANAGSSIKSLIDETAQVNGELPPKQAAFNNFMAGYLDEIWASIGDTEGGGYMYGGMQPGAWNDGAYGFITVRKGDPKQQYVHVTTPPASGNMVRIRDAGYKVTEVSDLRTGRSMRFDQSGGYLSITGNSTWDPYDTVFEVKTTGEHQFFYPQQSITATASPSRPEFPGSNLTDGSYLNYWDANQPVPGAGSPVPSSVLNPPGQPTVHGLLGEYYPNATWSGTPALTRVDDNVDASFGTAAPAAGIPTDHFSVRWTGTLTAPEAGEYPLGLTSDDGSQLFVDGALVVDNGGNHSSGTVTAEVHLDAGPHDVRIEYFDNTGNASVALNWLPPGATSAALAAIELDLGDQKPASYLAINQREWSPTHNRTTFGRQEDSSRIKDYRVYVSDDGVDWGDPVRTGTMPSARGIQFIPLGKQVTRHIRVEVLNTWGSPAVPAFFNRIAIDEIYVAHGYPFNAANPLPGEAEAPQNSRTGQATEVSCKACSGAAKVELTNHADSVAITGVQAAETGDYRLTVQYTSAGERSFSISANDGEAQELAVTGQSADVPETTSVVVPLTAGANTITLAGTDAGTAGVDRISVVPLPPPMFEAEAPQNTFSGSVRADNCTACSGGKKVRFIGNNPNNFLTFNKVQVGRTRNYQLTIDATVAGTRSFFVSVNGGPGTEVPVTGTSFNEVTSTTITVPLNAGDNTVKFFNDTANAPDLDRIVLS